MNARRRFTIAAIALTATLLKPALAQTTLAAPHAFGEVTDLADLQKQAAAGDATAEFELGVAYWTGKSVPQNLDLAQQWMDKASAAGSLEAQIFYGMALYNGYSIPKDHARAAKYLLLAADRTPAEPIAGIAQYYVASMYQQGDGLPQSTPQAIHYYQLAIAANSAAAAYDLGNIDFNGLGVHPDKDAACDLYQLAGEHGHVRAIAALALCYELGQGRDKDRNKALQLYKMAGDAGDFLASAKAATLYLNRNKLPEAYTWFRISEAEGNPSVQPDIDHLKSTMNPVQLSSATADFNQWHSLHFKPSTP